MPIKLPSIDYQLTTFKKFQQALSDNALLQRCTRDDVISQKVAPLFEGIWSLEDFGTEGAEANKAYEKALLESHKYVLKPQREGGGNNFFDDELKQQLLSIESQPEVKSFLIMEKIHPPISPSYCIRDGQLKHFDCVCELGLFSSLITKFEPGQANENTVLHEEVLGTLFRTKGISFNEGGISSGAAVLDYPLLVPTKILREKAEGLPERNLKCPV